ncbi:aldehyde dehydrogenase [candidate division WOR-3 bacterium JGI_Cruoil_03_44_89]|uniref:Aldehyde dehydrogenase n=1 Tax=candidate division WOR-3 bacterium JGI_Cruoil_03_44_89 TaxID=1973748 RepID=A0A235BR00_UNCW3|nr:MAG: aldehyde dehydrogenase [candidate division WOR-3 bacterium JGI_Cruoil_03_44_89]
MVYKNYISGRWGSALSEETFVKRNPANKEERIGEFPLSGTRDVNLACQAAKEALPKWRALPMPTRGEIMKQFGDLLTEHKEELARIETREMGKVLNETRGDVQEGIDTAYYAFGEARRFFGHTVPSELPDKLCLTFRRPIGVAGLITPWNFPVAIPCWKLVPALLSGNTVVFKPSREAPHSSTRIVELLTEAGVPGGVVNLVHGAGTTVGEAILSHPDIGVVSFTGSVETGRRIAEACGKTLKRVSLELGGKNGQIVLSDANLDLALEGVLWGAFGTTGQRCTATSRLILEEKIYDEFLTMLIARAEKVKIGNGLNEDMEMGPLISEKQLEKVKKYVEIGKSEGAKLACGGEVYTEGECAKGYFFKPTIFAEVKPDMRIAREEIFGPVLSVIRVRDVDEAIRAINDSSYGLSSSIYTRDINKALKARQRIEAGITYINGPTIGAECNLPFGGVKNTGNGHREGGWTVYEIFTEIQTVYIDYSGKLQKAQIDTEQ